MIEKGKKEGKITKKEEKKWQIKYTRRDKNQKKIKKGRIIKSIPSGKEYVNERKYLI
jgi:hypothetical protein